MGNLYTLRKKIGKNRFVEMNFKKIYMLIKEQSLKKNAKIEIEKIKNDIGANNGNNKILFYLDIPTHSNIGDIAQYCCIKDWLQNNYSDYKLFELSNEVILHAEKDFICLLKNNDVKQNIIFFQSGYCTQDLGGNHDYVHKMVLKNVNNIPIIMLPQTIFYKNDNNKNEAKEIYEKNKNVMIMCRDSVSYQIAQTIFSKNSLELIPDFVTSLIGTKKIKTINNRKGILICCRNDIERYYSDDQIKQLKSLLEEIDTVAMKDTTIQADFKKIKNNLYKQVEDMIDEFGKYRVVITDRYHGTIFSLIAGTPVIVLKTNDHKVVTGVDWLKVYGDSVCYLPNINDVNDKVKSIYLKYDYRKLNPYFKERYFSNLKSIIEQWRNS